MPPKGKTPVTKKAAAPVSKPGAKPAAKPAAKPVAAKKGVPGEINIAKFVLRLLR